MNPSIKQLIIDLIIECYKDFGPTLAAEKLKKKHGLKVSVESVRKIMMDAQIWMTRDKRLKRAYQPRYRRAAYGELIQIDGSQSMIGLKVDPPSAPFSFMWMMPQVS